MSGRTSSVDRSSRPLGMISIVTTMFVYAGIQAQQATFLGGFFRDFTTKGVSGSWSQEVARSTVSFQETNNTVTALTFIESTVLVPPSTAVGQLDQFMEQHPDTAGAKFVKLLRTHLHSTPGAENKRMDACNGKVPPNLIHCLTGTPPSSDFTTNPGISIEVLAKNTTMPFTTSLSVYDMPHYPDMDRDIPALGTLRTCLPLYLAGATVGLDKMAIELGPYFGLSSKCIVAGMKTNGVRENSYIAFDTFQGMINYNSIRKKRQHSWILNANPAFNEMNTSFLFLWEKAVKAVYPTAEGRAGYISAKTLNPKTIGKTAQEVDLISIDSAKSFKSLQDQLAGLGPLKVGTILFLLDFEFVGSQVKVVYECLRESGYLLPVYTAWRGRENWAFVVLKELSFSKFQYPHCRNNNNNHNNMNMNITQSYWVEQDVRLLASLQDDPKGETEMQSRIDDLSKRLVEIIKSPFKG